MTRRLFIFVDNKERKLYVSPEFNGDKSEYAQRDGALDTCDLAAEDLFRLFEVKTFSDFQKACAEAQQCFHSSLDRPNSAKELLPVTEIEVSQLPNLDADERIFILEGGRLFIAPEDWDGKAESLYERVREAAHGVVSLAQALNRLVTGQGLGGLNYCEGVEISKAESITIDGYLCARSVEQYQGEDNTITKSLIFPDGMQMDVKCCGSKDAPSWTEGVLFDRRGNEVAHTDVFDEFEGKWELVHEGILYTMIIKMEGEPW